MAPYGPDDPNNPDNQPTAYLNYGPTPGEPVPWFRKPVALVTFGALGAVLVALFVYGLVKVFSTDTPPETPRITPITPTSTSARLTTTTTSTQPETTTATTEPTTTTTEPTTTTTTTEPTTTTTTTTTPSTSVSTSISTSTVTQTVTVSPPPP